MGKKTPMIRPLKTQDIPSVVTIYRTELPGLLSVLDKGVLEQFYVFSLSTSQLFTLVHEDKRVIHGFVTGCTDTYGLMKTFVLKRHFNLLLPIIKTCMTHPKTVAKLINTLFYPGFTTSGAEILSLAITKRTQQKGIGKTLLHAALTAFAKRRIRSVRVSVYTRLPAQQFYTRTGAMKENTFDFNGEKMQYYRYTIR